METIFDHFGGPTFLLFKSYYVVWKPKNKVKEYNARGEFKSYYVVWKLEYLQSIIKCLTV